MSSSQLTSPIRILITGFRCTVIKTRIRILITGFRCTVIRTTIRILITGFRCTVIKTTKRILISGFRCTVIKTTKRILISGFPCTVIRTREVSVVDFLNFLRITLLETPGIIFYFILWKYFIQYFYINLTKLNFVLSQFYRETIFVNYQFFDRKTIMF